VCVRACVRAWVVGILCVVIIVTESELNYLAIISTAISSAHHPRDNSDVTAILHAMLIC